MHPLKPIDLVLKDDGLIKTAVKKSPMSTQKIVLIAGTLFLGAVASATLLAFGTGVLVHTYANVTFQPWLSHVLGTIGNAIPNYQLALPVSFLVAGTIGTVIIIVISYKFYQAKKPRILSSVEETESIPEIGKPATIPESGKDIETHTPRELGLLHAATGAPGTRAVTSLDAQPPLPQDPAEAEKKNGSRLPFPRYLHADFGSTNNMQDCPVLQDDHYAYCRYHDASNVPDEDPNALWHLVVNTEQGLQYSNRLLNGQELVTLVDRLEGADFRRSTWVPILFNRPAAKPYTPTLSDSLKPEFPSDFSAIAQDETDTDFQRLPGFFEKWHQRDGEGAVLFYFITLMDHEGLKCSKRLDIDQSRMLAKSLKKRGFKRSLVEEASSDD